MAEELDFGSDFLDHSTRAAGSGFLKNWKEDGQIQVWIHPQAPIYSLWSHGWRKYDVDKDDDNKEFPIIRNIRFNCFESEALLKKQKWRTKPKDGDERELPPVICPHCKSVEWVRTQINEGKLKWSDPIFKFVVDDPAGGEEEIIYAGAYCGLFQKRELSKSENAEIRKTGVKISESYLQNGYARQQYVFAVASNSDPDAGWVIAIESQTLGDKMKKAIVDEIKRCGGEKEKGHPGFNPYPFEWSYDENKEFSHKYDVVALSRIEPNHKLIELLKQEPPDMSQIVAAPSLGVHLKSMKEAALIDMPIDDWFEAAIEKYGLGEEEEEKTDDASSVDSESDEEEIACDVCNEPMSEEDMVCNNCGAKYGENDDGDVVLKSRKCGNPDCMETEVPVNDDGTGTCPQCGAVHDSDWNFELPEAKPAAAKKGRSARSSKRAQARASSSKR